MRASIYIATSLDGFIARQDGNIDWLMAESALDGAYLAQHKPEYVDKEVLGRVGPGRMSPEDRDDIKRRLEGIGYIG